MNKIKVALLLCLLALGMTLVACGGSTAAPTTAPTTAPAQEVVAEEPADTPAQAADTCSETVEIEWWHISTAEAEQAYWQSKADEFMAENPCVKINITVLENEAFKSRLTTVMQSGQPPDLFQSWGGGVLWAYADAGLLKDITPALRGEWQDSVAAKAALDLYSKDGAYYGVPWQWGAVGIYYNKDLFEQAGLDPENPPKTWSEFLGAVQTLKDAGITPITIGEGDKWPGHFWWVYLAIRNGGEDAFLKAFTRDGSFTDAPFVKAGEDLQELINLEPFPQGYLGFSYGDSASAFGNGEAAMELMGQWHQSVQRSNSESGEGVANLGWFPFPMVEGGAGNASDVLGGGDGIAVGKNASEEAVAFLRFLTRPENQIQALNDVGFGPPTMVGTETAITDPIQQAIVQARNNAAYFQLYYDQFLPPAVGGAVNDAVEQLFAGVISAAELAQQIEDAAAMELGN
ncbi:MAG TPA: extracellular solute-binding protein [Chloroflexota bacterium]|nr:extracellular solute-binding protein [Chloroflexota bacterium]